MSPKTTNLIFGPPGCGKTTNCLDVVDDALNAGIPSDQIAFIAFTRKAATEARERACTKFNLSPDQLPWFRTLHSLAFAQLNLNRGSVMGLKDYIELARVLGVSITYKGISHEDGTFNGLTRGDRLFFMENMARTKLMNLREYWEQYPDEDIYWYELERVQKTLAQYKRERNKSDFTDIITNFCGHDTPIPHLRLLVVDETQDLSLLQWAMVDKISDHVDQTFLAGDDDQAIFRWAGADVDYLIDIPGTRRILNQSYRVPSIVQGLANEIISRVSHRVEKVWNSRPAEGVIEYENNVDNIDMGRGTWLLLGRNAYLLESYKEYCIRNGYVFSSSTGSPISTDTFHAIRDWEYLREGNKITAARIKKIYDCMSIRIGVTYGFKGRLDELPDREMLDIATLRSTYGLITDHAWHVALDKITETERQYFLSALQRGEKLLSEPRIRISTIHSAKGGEAQNIVICLDMADRTWNEYQKNPDDEHRVWYVAITRTKERLIVLTPQTKKHYVI